MTFAIIAGLIFKHFTGRDTSWLIVVMTIVPDIDFVFQSLLLMVKSPFVIYHGDFHNILMMVSFSYVVAWLASNYGMEFSHAFICSNLGMGLHYIEDFISYPPAYAYFYPFSTIEYGIDLIHETRDLYVVGSEVLGIGLVLLICAVTLRKDYEKNWTFIGYVGNLISVIKNLMYNLKMIVGGTYVF